MSKLAKNGDAARKRLIKSHSLWGKYHSSNRAQAEIQAAIVETIEGDLSKHVMRSCREAAKEMEDILFSVGGADRIIATIDTECNTCNTLVSRDHIGHISSLHLRSRLSVSQAHLPFTAHYKYESR